LGHRPSFGQHRVDQRRRPVALGGQQVAQDRPQGAQLGELGGVAVAPAGVVVFGVSRVHLLLAGQRVRVLSAVHQVDGGL
jgi:hypothetical protein